VPFWDCGGRVRSRVLAALGSPLALACSPRPVGLASVMVASGMPSRPAPSGEPPADGGGAARNGDVIGPFR